MPKNQAELESMVAEARAMYTHGKAMAKLTIGFDHFTEIFQMLDGWVEVDGMVGGVSADSDAENTQHDGSVTYPSSGESSEEEEEGEEHSSHDEETKSDRRSSSSSAISTDATTVSGKKRKSKASKAQGVKSKEKKIADREVQQRMARRTHQLQDNSLRFMETFKEMNTMTDGLMKVMRDLGTAISESRLKKMEVVAKMQAQLEQTTDPRAQYRLKIMIDMLFADILAPENNQSRASSQLAPTTELPEGVSQMAAL